MRIEEGVDKISFRVMRNLTPKQNAALDAAISRPNARVFVGGAGFGGKSYVCRAFAVWFMLYLYKLGFRKQKFHFACYSYESLRDRHFSAFEKEYGGFGRITDSHKQYGRAFVFNDPEIGAICLRNLKDPEERRGSEYCGGVLDEATEVLHRSFGDFAYTVRPSFGAGEEAPPFSPILLASNPDGIGHSWCKALWRPHLHRRLWTEGDPLAWSCNMAFPSTTVNQFSLENLDPEDYIYIPFLPDDNPNFDEARFWAGVAHLPLHVQRARRYGLWDAPEGARWPQLDEGVHLFRLAEQFRDGLPPHWPKIMHIDYGLRNPYCCLWTAFDEEGTPWTYRCDYKAGLTADVQARRMIDLTPMNEHISAIKADPAIWQKLPAHQGIQPSVYDIYEEAFAPARAQGRAFGHIEPGFNKSRNLAFATLDRLIVPDNGFPTWRIEESCQALWMELTGAVFDHRTGTLSHISEEIDPRNPDHAITAAYYGLHDWTPNSGTEAASIIGREHLREEEERLIEQELLRSMRR